MIKIIHKVRRLSEEEEWKKCYGGKENKIKTKGDKESKTKR